MEMEMEVNKVKTEMKREKKLTTERHTISRYVCLHNCVHSEIRCNLTSAIDLHSKAVPVMLFKWMESNVSCVYWQGYSMFVNSVAVT